MILRGASPEHFPWLLSRVDGTASPNFRAIEVVDDSGRIHGMVGFDGWTSNSVVMTIALDNPACLRTLIRPAFEYAFVTGGKGVAIATIRASNSRSIRLCKSVGMSEIFRIRDGLAVGEDIVVMELRRENCRWIGNRKAA